MCPGFYVSASSSFQEIFFHKLWVLKNQSNGIKWATQAGDPRTTKEAAGPGSPVLGPGPVRGCGPSPWSLCPCPQPLLFSFGTLAWMLLSTGLEQRTSLCVCRLDAFKHRAGDTVRYPRTLGRSQEKGCNTKGESLVVGMRFSAWPIQRRLVM